MSRVIDEARSRIEAALADLDAERRSLAAALVSLDGSNKAVPGRARKKPRPAATKKRAGRGQRRAQFLGVVREQPGITVAEASKKIGLTAPNALYPLAKKLVKEKAITKKGSGYAIKSSTPVKAKRKGRKKAN